MNEFCFVAFAWSTIMILISVISTGRGCFIFYQKQMLIHFQSFCILDLTPRNCKLTTIQIVDAHGIDYISRMLTQYIGIYYTSQRQFWQGYAYHTQYWPFDDILGMYFQTFAISAIHNSLTFTELVNVSFIWLNTADMIQCIRILNEHLSDISQCLDPVSLTVSKVGYAICICSPRPWTCWDARTKHQ